MASPSEWLNGKSDKKSVSGPVWFMIFLCESFVLAVLYFTYLFHETCKFTFILSHDICSATLSNCMLFEYFHFKICQWG